jgi:hypothetical protein
MNERIKQLAEQAQAQYCDLGDASCFKRLGLVEAVVFTPEDLEKFAELIVKDITAGQRELAKIMSDTGSGNEAYILRITASNIERKYGVEE